MRRQLNVVISNPYSRVHTPHHWLPRNPAYPQRCSLLDLIIGAQLLTAIDEMSREVEALKRHREIRTALKFFLDSWYKHRQAGTVPHKQQVLFDFTRFRSLEAVLQELRTKAPQVPR